MYKNLICILLFGFLIVGAVGAHDFKLNDGFSEVTEYYSMNDDGMRISTWDYNDTDLREAYLENSTHYTIVSGDNDTYNVTYDTNDAMDSIILNVSDENATMDHGILEIAEVDGNKYIIMSYLENGTDADWKSCYDELMKFNENNAIVPLADAI
jgi:hypothetical protein